MIPTWIIKLKDGHVYKIRVKGFYFNDDGDILNLVLAYNKKLRIYLRSILNRYELTLYVGGSV